MRIMTVVSLVLVILGCHQRILIPGRDENRVCLRGVCMPYLNLEVIVTTDRAREFTILLLNPHDEEDCEDETNERGTHAFLCRYRAPGLVPPFIFVVTSSPAREPSQSTCALDPHRVSVQRLDTHERFDVRRVRTETGVCLYEARRHPLQDAGLPTRSP
jgi:hypothetical protein